MSADMTDYQDIRDAVRDLCASFPPEYFREIDAKRAYPEAFVDALTRAGWMAALIPQEFGGSGLGLAEASVIMEEINRSGGNAGACHGQMYNMGTLLRHGSAEQKERYLPKMAKGEIIGCFGLTEPDHGSNPSDMRTTAIDDGDSWILNGTKRWITNGNISNVALVWAKVGGVNGVVHGFLVDTDKKGFEARLIHKKMSLRASVTSELILEDVRIPKDAILPNVKGMKGPLSCLTSARFGIAWGVIGAARACFESALDYAKHRVQFAGKPIAAHQLVQAKFAEMLTQITNSQLLALEAARLKEEKKLKPAHVSMIKRHNVRAALEISRMCRDILGGNGITLEYPVMRHMCNLETVYTYEGTHDIHTLILGQEVTGIPAYE